MSTMQPFDMGVSGVHAQAFASRAIKLGSMIRYQPRVRVTARTAGALPALCMLAVTVAVILGDTSAWWLLAWLLTPLLGLALMWITAAVVGDHSDESAQASHLFVFLRRDADGTEWITESVGSGARIVKMHYHPNDYRIVKTSTLIHCPAQAEGATQFAENVVSHHAKYGRLTFAALGLACVLGGKLGFELSGTWVCSGYGCDMGVRWNCMPSGAWWFTPYRMMPIDVLKQARAERVPVLEPGG